jgi:hypothetical protein
VIGVGDRYQVAGDTRPCASVHQIAGLSYVNKLHNR